MLEQYHSIFAIGDIHGSHENLLNLLARLPIREDSLLVFMGDYINRGPDASKVLDTLITIRKQYAHTVFLMGNHEYWLLEYADHGDVETLRVLRKMGIEATLASYGATVRELAGLAFMPESHREFVRGLSLSHSAGRYLFVHADTDEALLAAGTHPDASQVGISEAHRAVELDKALSSRRLLQENDTIFSTATASSGHDSANGRIVVFAHAPFETPLVLPDRICVDTGAVYGNLLTAVELPIVRFYHA